MALKDPVARKEYNDKFNREHKDYFHRYYIAHKAEMVARALRHYQANIDNELAKRRDRYKANRKTALAQSAAWHRNNPGKANAKTRRRQVAKLRATPPWLTAAQLKQTEAYYVEAKRREQADGIKRHVDHIYPLQGKTVSGLHVPWNLQILTATANHRKLNKLPVFNF